MKQTIRDLDLKGKRLLIRVDFNVPLDDSRRVTDDTRIRASLATIEHALKAGAKCVILMSHLGRPKGKPNPKMSLKPAGDRLAKLLGRPVELMPDCVGESVEKAIAGLAGSTVALLENLRLSL